MEFNPRKDLSSCLSSFVPFFLSIPFLFVYYLQRLSIYISFSLILFLFLIHYIVLHRFYNKEVFLRAHFLTLILTIGAIWSITSPAIGLFTIVLSIFHLSEYISVAFWCPRTLNIHSFLLNHSPQYHGAIVIAYIEYILEKYYFFPDGLPYHWISIILGLVIVLNGEYLRKLAMYTAKENFSHLIEDKPDEKHCLITNGIYQTYRHPSYVGFFWWACGTQILLANPICFLIYLIATWLFFADRIVYEEATLIRCYGNVYRNYQKRVPTDQISRINDENLRGNSRASIIRTSNMDVYPFLLIFSVVTLAFLASVGLTLLVLGCALSEYNWWPTFVIIFYILCPITIAIERRCISADTYGMNESSSCTDVMWFITSAIIVSAFGFPAILCRASIIVVGSMAFVMAANVLIFATIIVYFLTFGADDNLLIA